MARREAANLLDLLKIREGCRKKIDAINGNLGSALGFKHTKGRKTDSPSILIFVPKKIREAQLAEDQVIPKELEIHPDGEDTLYCKTDVVRGGKAQVLGDPPPLDKPNREIVEKLRGGGVGLVGGAQIGGYNYAGRAYVGTIGCAVVDPDERTGLLTNEHVSGPVGRPIYFPEAGRKEIGKTSKSLNSVPDEVHYDGLVDEENASIRVDCGVVRLSPEAASAAVPGLYEIGGLGEVLPVDRATMDVIGLDVISIGRSRGVQEGRVVAYAYEWRDEEDWSTYTDLLIIGVEPGGAFSFKGDSGKLIVTAAGSRPVALLWGGWQERLRSGFEQENWTYAIEVAKVLEYLDVRILT
jgi:hypothetical protein